MNRKTIHTAQAFMRCIAIAVLSATAFLAGSVHAQAPVPEAVPAVLPNATKAALDIRRTRLDEQRKALAQKVAAHNARCRNVPPENAALTADCSAAQQSLNSEVQTYRQSVVAFNNDLATAIDAVRPQMQARVKELDVLIQRDAQAIRHLGFARRAEDFAEWERLGAKAKTEFEDEVMEAITGIAVDKLRSGVLSVFKDFDAAKAARMTDFIRTRGVKPEPVALIAAIERVGRAPDKSRIADDAALIVRQFEDWRKAREAMGGSNESIKEVGNLLEGFISDPRVGLLMTGLKLTTAAVYNNATRRVARHEVERLTTLTEQQLKDLERLRKLMETHVRERNALVSVQGGAGK